MRFILVQHHMTFKLRCSTFGKRILPLMRSRPAVSYGPHFITCKMSFQFVARFVCLWLPCSVCDCRVGICWTDTLMMSSKQLIRTSAVVCILLSLVYSQDNYSWVWLNVTGLRCWPNFDTKTACKVRFWFRPQVTLCEPIRQATRPISCVVGFPHKELYTLTF